MNRKRQVSDMKDMAILERRRIEANVLGHVFEVMCKRLNETEARSILREAISNAAVAHGKELADDQGGERNLQDFADLMPAWTKEDALEIDMLHESEERLEFNVVRCRYSEMYKEMGLGDIGDLLSCNRDGKFCTGYNPDIELTRTQTIMKGAGHCDFRFRMKSKS
jgi:predicted hydrocarbon binding protein